MKKIIFIAIFILSCSSSNKDLQSEYDALTSSINEAKQTNEILIAEKKDLEKIIKKLKSDKILLKEIKGGSYEEFMNKKIIEKENYIVSINKLKKNKLIMEEFLSGKKYIVVLEVKRSDGLRLNFKTRKGRINIEVSREQFDRYNKGQVLFKNSAIKRHLAVTVYEKKII